MSRQAAQLGHRHIFRSRLAQKVKCHRPIFESLEDRLMLAAGGSNQHPAGIVVGRTSTTPVPAWSSAPVPSNFVAGKDRPNASSTVSRNRMTPQIVSISTPNVDAANADSLNPYTFSITYSGKGVVDRGSIAGSVVDVLPPVGTPNRGQPG